MVDVHIPEEALTADAFHDIVKFAGVSGCMREYRPSEQIARNQQNGLALLDGAEPTHCNQRMSIYWLDWYDWELSLEP